MPDRRRDPTTEARRLWNRALRRGPREVMELGLGRLREWGTSSNEIVMHSRPTEPGPSQRDGFVGRPATVDDADAYARDIGTDSAETFRERLAPDVSCFVVAEGKRLLHASWLTTTAAWTREIRAYLAPPEGDAYVYESFTHPDARGRGLYPLALSGLLDLGAQRGHPCLWVGVEASNAPSLRAVSKAGFETRFTIAYARSLGRLKLIEPPEDLPERATFLRYGKQVPS